MPDPAQFGTAIVAISNLLTLSIASGLIFVVLIQPKRDQTNNLFALFCLCLGSWGLVNLMNIIPEMRFGMQAQILLYVLATALGLTAITFFLFIFHFAKADGRLTRLLQRLSPVIIVVGLLIVWTGQAFTLAGSDSSEIQLKPLGYVTLGFTVVYTLGALWAILNSRNKQISLLRVPAVLLVVAFGVNGLGNLIQTPIDTLLATVVAVWVGWVVMYYQLFNPLKELNQEMSVANRDLRQVVSDLASEKGKTEKLNQELQTANRYKTEFLANMSHELRTPLNSIVGYSELLMDGIYGQLTAQQVDRMEKIYRNGKSLLDLITDILDITKIEAGRLEMHISTFSLAEVIDEVLGQKKSDSDTKGLRVKTQLAENLSPIRADRERIQQIFHNLISNAIKFTPSGEITIEAQNAVVQNGVSKTFKLPLIGWLRDGNWLIFSVKDTGIGISAEDQSHIFDAFWQVDRSPTREFEGTGMGLAITRKLVELHEGTIWVKSLLNQGSTFFVAIPVQQELMNVVSQNGASVEHVDVTASNSTEKTSDSNL